MLDEITYTATCIHRIIGCRLIKATAPLDDIAYSSFTDRTMKFKVGHILLFEPSSIAGDSSAIFEPCTDSCGCNACNELVCSRRDAEVQRMNLNIITTTSATVCHLLTLAPTAFLMVL